VELSASTGSVGEWNLSAHTGLTVYNLYRCPAGRTTYIYDETGPQVWNGRRWQALNPRPVITEAGPAETSGTNIWGKSVVRHATKMNPDYDAIANPTVPPNIYEEFYSADFGAAGRWMTTNLAAWAYDSKVTGVSLPTSPDASNSGCDPHWCYPNGGNGGADVTTYDNNPLLGFLYNWPAATGKQNTSTEQQGQVAGSTPGLIEVESVASGGKYQGICPDGWHLPSDREWNQLEKQIYENPQLYSSYADNSSFPDNGTWNAAWETTGGYRPTGSPANSQGKAMKEICGVNATNPNGQSNSPANGGFNALLASTANNGSTYSFGDYADFWSCSSYSSYNAWHRILHYNLAAVFREGTGRSYMFSVRCKKD
jgi:uncharacterized protein (TIGR02145 family)